MRAGAYRKMDGNPESKAALLGEAMKRGGSGRRGGRLSRRYSVNSLRSEFISRLPEKLRSRLQDVESPYEIDLSRSPGFCRGSSLSLPVSPSLCLSLFFLLNFSLVAERVKKLYVKKSCCIFLVLRFFFAFL